MFAVMADQVLPANYSYCGNMLSSITTDIGLVGRNPPLRLCKPSAELHDELKVIIAWRASSNRMHNLVSERIRID
jgi:hypothetical protein